MYLGLRAINSYWLGAINFNGTVVSITSGSDLNLESVKGKSRFRSIRKRWAPPI